MSTQPISEAQLAANRANAQLSTGPVTEAGRAASSQNATKHGLTGKIAILPGEDPARFRAMLDMWGAVFQPKNDYERSLVDSIVSSDWRMGRIKRIEGAIHTKGQFEFHDRYQDQPELIRQTLILGDVYLKYEKQLKNLALQENRLRRYIERDKKELAEAQARRFRAQQAEAEAAAAESAANDAPAEAAAKAQTPAAPNQNGFVFSTGQNQPSQSPVPTPTNRVMAANTQPQSFANHPKGV